LAPSVPIKQYQIGLVSKYFFKKEKTTATTISLGIYCHFHNVAKNAKILVEVEHPDDL